MGKKESKQIKAGNVNDRKSLEAVEFELAFPPVPENSVTLHHPLSTSLLLNPLYLPLKLSLFSRSPP